MDKVRKIYNENRAKDSSYQWKQALIDAGDKNNKGKPNKRTRSKKGGGLVEYGVEEEEKDQSVPMDVVEEEEKDQSVPMDVVEEEEKEYPFVPMDVDSPANTGGKKRARKSRRSTKRKNKKSMSAGKKKRTRRRR